MLGGHKQITIFLLCVNIPAYKGQVHIKTPIIFGNLLCTLHVTCYIFTFYTFVIFSGTRALHFFSWWHHDDSLLLPSWGGCYAIVCTYIVCTPVGPPSDTTWYIPSDLTWYIHETAVGQRKHSLTHMKSFHGIYFMYVCEACISYVREFCAV